MFKLFKKKQQVQEEVKEELSEKDKVQIQQLLQTKKLPVVVIDHTWYQMKEALGSIETAKMEEDLKELIKEQAKLNKEIKEYGVVKQNLLQQVLVVSEEVNQTQDESKTKELDKLSQGIVKVNESLENLETRATEVDEIIRQTNTQIIQKVVEEAYKNMSHYKAKVAVLQGEIDHLRESMLEKTSEKKQLDQAINVIYNYLHKIIGYQYLDKVDRKIGAEKKGD